MKKILIGALISLIPFVGGFIILGWALLIVRNTYEGVDNRLPEWDDIGGMLVKGLTAWVGALIWALPLIVLGLCFTIALVASSGSDAATGTVILLGVGMFFVSIVYASLILPIPIARYAVKGEFSAMLQFSEILNEIRRGIKPLLIALVIWLVASQVIAPIGFFLCFVGVFLTTTLSYVMIGHAMGQAYREIDGKGPMPPAQSAEGGPVPPPAPSQTTF